MVVLAGVVLVDRLGMRITLARVAPIDLHLVPVEVAIVCATVFHRRRLSLLLKHVVIFDRSISRHGHGVVLSRHSSGILPALLLLL